MDSTLFPIKPEMHIIFALISLLVFGMQFIRYRKKYHLLLAIGIPCSLLPYLSDNKMLFYGVGIAEVVLLIAALVLAKTVDREPAALQTEAAAVSVEEAAEPAAEVSAQEETEA